VAPEPVRPMVKSRKSRTLSVTTLKGDPGLPWLLYEKDLLNPLY
jgi:hypothetical protein